MSTLVELAAELRPYADGRGEIAAPGATLGELLQAVAELYPRLGARIAAREALPPELDVLAAGRDLRLAGGLAARLADGARLRLALRRPRPLGGEDALRYSRQLILPEVGPEGQDRLRAAQVAVVGAGGLGAPVLAYLAAAGVGHLTVIDGDVVERSNLHRQPIHRDRDVGASKAQSARRFIEELNPDVAVRVCDRYLGADNAMELLGDADLVVLGADNFPTRYLVSDACVFLGIALVDASILRFEGRISVFLPRQGCYRCLFPVPPPPGSVPGCAEAGVIGALAGQIGAMQALETVKLITGAGRSLAGRLLIYDALAAEQRSFRIARDPGCPVCGDSPTQTSLIDYEAFCGLPPRTDAKEAAEIPALQAAARLAAGDTVWLDVRPQTSAPRPTIPGAVPLALEAIEAGALPDARDRRIIAFCEIGLRSRVAAQLLAEAGLAAESLQGGLVAWRAAGLRLEPARSAT